MSGFIRFLIVLGCIGVLIALFGGLSSFSGGKDRHLSRGNIAVIEIEGVIDESLPILEQIQRASEANDYKAVVVRVNSPGGAVGASQEIYMELKRLRASKPIVVTMGDMAGSGGLYVSLGGSHLMALPGTITGSMGVLVQLMNVSRLMNKLLLDPVTVRSGELKDAGNPTKPLDPRAKKLFEDLIDMTFKTFKKTVVEERKLKDSVVTALSDGRIVNGEQALEWGLVDSLGTFQDAVLKAKELGKITHDVELAYLSRKPESWADYFMGSMIQPLKGELKSLFQQSLQTYYMGF